MSNQSEALRLANLIEGSVSDLHREAAAIELRRLHAENETLGVHLSERMKDLFKVEAQRDALLEALEKIAAIEDQMYGNDWEEIEEARVIARAAIAKMEKNT